MMDGVLVIGIGNPLRSDDAIGRHAVEAVARDDRLDGVQALITHQLLPELALDMSRAGLVVLVDARIGLTPGMLVIEPVRARSFTAIAWSHHLDPASLAGMAWDLFKAAPDVYTIGVGVGSMGLGERLSPECESAVPRIVDAISQLVAAHSSGQARQGPHA